MMVCRASRPTLAVSSRGRPKRHDTRGLSTIRARTISTTPRPRTKLTLAMAGQCISTVRFSIDSVSLA
ncbi:hypothetical protein D3C71_1121150 [compost metagenome]